MNVLLTLILVALIATYEKVSKLMSVISALIVRAVDDLTRLAAQNASLQADNAAKDKQIADLQAQVGATNDNTATADDVTNLTNALTTADAQLTPPAPPAAPDATAQPPQQQS